MATYIENLEINMSMVWSSDTYEPVPVNLIKLLPEKDWDKTILTSFMEVFSNEVGIWLYKIQDIAVGLDPYKAGNNLISHLSTVIGFPLFDESGVSLAEKRRQLTRAIDAYKQKGSYKGITGILRTVGILSEIKDMFVKKEVFVNDTKINYEDFDKHAVSDWFVGDNPPALTGYFKTPHFFMNILLTTLQNPGITESLWNAIQERKLNSMIELMRPINTWPVKNLLMEFHHTYSRGGISTSIPNIYSIYIDRRPLGFIGDEPFKLNAETLEVSEIVDEDGFQVKNNNDDFILSVSSGSKDSWKLNKGIKLNYSLNQERLIPQYFLLGKQNKPFYTFFDSFIDVGVVEWQDHEPDFSFYKQSLINTNTAGNFTIKNGYFAIGTPALSYQKRCHIDLFDKNSIVQFKAYIDNYPPTNHRQGSGCLLRGNRAADTGVKYYFVNESNGDCFFKVKMYNPSGEYELLSKPLNVFSVGWHEIKIVSRGYFSDVYFDTKIMVENLDIGDPVKLGGWDYGTYFSFYAPEFDHISFDAKFKDLSIIRLGNQGQEFTFDEPMRILSDSLEGVEPNSIDGDTPWVSFYDEPWHDPNGILTYKDVSYLGKGVRLDTNTFPSTDAYITLKETRLKINFNFKYNESYQAGRVRRSGCYIKGSGRYLKENLKIYVEHSYTLNPRIKIIGYEEDTEKAWKRTYIDEELAATDLLAFNRGWNKFTIYLEEDKIKVYLNDYSNWTLDLTIFNPASPSYEMDEGTRFGFFVKNDNVTSVGDFGNLDVWRYSLVGAKDISSQEQLLEDNFDDVNDTLLKNHTPDVNNIGNVWVDPNDAWKIFGNELIPNTSTKSDVLASYINVGQKEVDVVVKFRINHPTSDVTSMGVLLKGNSNSKKAIRVVYEALTGVSSGALKIDAMLDGEIYKSMFTVGVGLLALDITLRVRFRKNKISLWRTQSGDENNCLATTFDYEDNFGYNLSLWWDPDVMTYQPTFTYLLVNDIINEEEILSISDKAFGELNVVHDELNNKYEFDFIVDRNLEFLGASEVAFLAGDGITELGGATFPTLDKHAGETLQIKGDMEYQ